MKTIYVNTQQELDAALKEPDALVVCRGSGQFVVSGSSQVRASGSSQVWASGSSRVWASDSSQVWAYDSSQVRASGSSQVWAYDSSQVRASGSSQVRASGSSQVRASDSSQVWAYDSSQVRASDSSQVRASKYVVVTVHGKQVKITGGALIRVPVIRTPKQWCEFYGVTVKGGVALLFKAVGDDFKSPRGGDYTPGTRPEAQDWDGGVAECGGGLHFSPRPSAALGFNPEAKRFVACPVRLADIAVHKDASMPQKVKARRVSKPCYEVDIDGNPVVRT